MEFYSRTSPARKRRWPRFLTALSVVLVSGFVIHRQFSSGPIISPLADEPQPQTSFFSLFSKKKSPQDLRKRIQGLVGSKWKNYSVYVKDLQTGFTMGINEHVIFTAASLYKVPVLATLYDEATRGSIDMDATITLQQKDIQDFGTGTIRYDPPGSVYSLKTLAKLMINQSDNTAGFILGQQILGYNKIQEKLAQWGMIQTDMANNKTSNADMANIFEKIFTGKIANQAKTLEMLSFFRDTEFESRIPALLPDSAIVYHKIGNEIRIIHDVGIVTDGTHAYYIGILSTDVPDEAEAEALSARIAQQVHNYLTQ